MFLTYYIVVKYATSDAAKVAKTACLIPRVSESGNYNVKKTVFDVKNITSRL